MTTSIISYEDYVGAWASAVTVEIEAAIRVLLPKVNALLQNALDNGVPLNLNPETGNYVAGNKNGYGGLRPRKCPQGAPTSSHKDGRGVDVFDLGDALDKWLSKFELGFGQNTKLREFGLCREAPTATESWLHLSDRLPPSGRDTFNP